MLAHQSELKHLLGTLEQKNSKVDILLLCETFLTKTTTKLVNIPGYKLSQTINSIAKEEAWPSYLEMT